MQTLEKAPKTEAKPATRFQGKDLSKQVVIGNLAVSPDGSSVVYVKRTVEEGKYVRRLWRTTFKGGRPDQLTTATANDTRPRFRPDGKALMFLSDRSGKNQVWVLPMTGGEPQKLTDMPNGVGTAEWSPDGQRLLVLAPSGEKRFLVGKPEDPVARVIRDYNWRFDGAGIIDELTSAWVVETATGKVKRITSPTCNVVSAAWSPDGKHIAFAADMRPEAALEEIPQLWATTTTGEAKPTAMAELKGGVFLVAWAPSEEIAFLGIDKEHTPWWAEWELHLTDGRSQRRLAADKGISLTQSAYGDFQDGEVLTTPPPQWRDKQNLVALVAHRGEAHPYRFERNGEVEALARPEAVCLSIATGGGRVAVAASMGGPTEVYAVEKGELRPLTVDGGRWFVPFKRAFERVDVAHPDGHTIDTYLLPANGDRTTKAPLVLDVHGGPNASFGPTPWLEMNALADAGLHVVWCNPRGSVGYGEEYSRAVAGRWGEDDQSDLLRVVDWAVEQGLTDRGSIGIMGLSYGGFMTNWMLGHHPGVFKAAVSENPVTDMLSEYANADGGRFIGREAAGVEEPWANAQRFLEVSPYTRIHLNHSPLLLLQAENDLRCPPVNSEMVFNILRTLGRDVEMARYPGESHAMFIIGRPDRRSDRIDRIVGWFQKHLPRP